MVSSKTCLKTVMEWKIGETIDALATFQGTFTPDFWWCITVTSLIQVVMKSVVKQSFQQANKEMTEKMTNFPIQGVRTLKVVKHFHFWLSP